MRFARLGVVVALVLAAGACTQGDPTGDPSASSSASPGESGVPESPGTSGGVTKPPITPEIPPPADGAQFNGAVVTRTGGIAGIMQQLVIAPDGAWVYTDERSGATEQGKLTESQRQQLLGMVSNPALVTESARGGGNTCNDGFIYSVAVVGLTIDYEQCGDASQRPLTEQLLNFLTNATPM